MEVAAVMRPWDVCSASDESLLRERGCSWKRWSLHLYSAVCSESVNYYITCFVLNIAYALSIGSIRS